MALDRESRWGFVVSVAAYGIAFAAVVFTGAQRHPRVVVFAALLLLVAAGVANMTVRRVRERRQLPVWQRTAVPLALTVVAIGLAFLFFRRAATDGFGMFCIVGAFITMGHFVGEMRSWSRVRLPLGLGLLALVTALVVGGVWVGADNPVGLYVALGALLIGPIGLTLLSAAVLRSGDVRPVSNLLIGAAVLVLGAAWLAQSGVDRYFAVIAIGVLLLLVLTITADAQTDVVLVATLVALVWSVYPRAVQPDDEVVTATSTSVADQSVLVALGDSYMSGEGAQRFYEGTNSPGGDQPNECRRAPTAYARLVLDAPESAELVDRLGFFACSGAVGRDLWQRPQYAGEPPGGEPATQLEQLSVLMESGAQVPLVVVSIGGNDASFADVGITCVAPGNCVARGARWLDQLQEVAERLDTAYGEIRRVVSDDVPVLAVPYPQPINADRTGCGYSLLEPQEHKFLNGFVRQLNGVVRKAAREHGFYYLAQMEQAMESARMRICDNGSNQDGLGVNFVAISDTEGLIDQLANPFGWLHNSLHPNERGHGQMTRVLAGWMESHPAPEGLSDEAGSEVYGVATLQDVMGPTFSGSYCGQPGFDADRCARSDLAWTVTEVSRFLRGILGPAAVMVLGAWLVSLALLTAVRPLTKRASSWLSRRLFGLLGRIGTDR
jgi:GDSL-like Lipase/Acylhydrolase family